MRFKLSRPYLNRETHRFERLVLGDYKIRDVKFGNWYRRQFNMRKQNKQRFSKRVSQNRVYLTFMLYINFVI